MPASEQRAARSKGLSGWWEQGSLMARSKWSMCHSLCVATGQCWSLIVIGLRNIRFEELRASISRGRGGRQRSDGSGIILRFCVAARSNFQTQAQGHFCVQRTTDNRHGLVSLVLSSMSLLTLASSHRPRICASLFDCLITWSWNGWEWSTSNSWSWKYINFKLMVRWWDGEMAPV